MGEKLKAPPLVEAVCEFRFDPAATWDWTIPGQLYEKIREDFPVTAQTQSFGLALQAGMKPAQPPNVQATRIQTGPARVQLKRGDNTAMVQVGPHLLAVNHLRPYPEWEQFRSLAMRMFGAYTSVSKESSLRQVGLRYINQIEVPEAGCKIEDYLTVKPSLSGYLAKELSAFFQRYELIVDQPKAALIHQTGFQFREGRPVIFVDLDLVSNQVADLMDCATVERWLDAAHACVYHAFKASLSPGFFEMIRQDER